MGPAILRRVNILRGLFSAVLLVAGLVGFAGPAQANPNQPTLEGTYTYHQEGVPEGTWEIYPVCVPVVGDLRVEIRDTVACTMTVAASPQAVARSGTARLTGGLWAYTARALDGLSCPDGSEALLLDTYKFDANTLTGTRTLTHGETCGLQPNLETKPFTLTYRGPLAFPVQEYPLYCEPGGLRRCY